MQDFSVEGVRQMFEGSVFRESGQNFLLSEALKFGGIFQNFALKLFKILKIMEKISEKIQKIQEKFHFCELCWEK